MAVCISTVLNGVLGAPDTARKHVNTARSLPEALSRSLPANELKSRREREKRGDSHQERVDCDPGEPLFASTRLTSVENEQSAALHRSARRAALYARPLGGVP